MVPTHREPTPQRSPTSFAGGAFLHRNRAMTRDKRQRRNQISFLIDMRERCEDIREKMEAKQSRWLERENVFTFRSCLQPSKPRRGVSHSLVETPVLRLVESNQRDSEPIVI